MTDKQTKRLERFLKTRLHSEQEVNTYLKLKLRIPTHKLEEELENLRELGFVDDEKFARWWLDQRLEYTKKGVRFILSELRAKGISTELAEKVIAECDPEELREREVSLIDRELVRTDVSDQTEFAKLANKLQSRGIDSNLIFNKLNDVKNSR